MKGAEFEWMAANLCAGGAQWRAHLVEFERSNTVAGAKTMAADSTNSLYSSRRSERGFLPILFALQ